MEEQSGQRGARPRIILHIGRNKAGSTTIQDVCLSERASLAAQGIDYVLFGHLADSRSDVAGFATFEALREHALAHRDRRMLVSNEFMFGWPDVYTEAARRVLRDCDVQILAYIRRYDDWIVSAYAEETRKGMNRRDIDEYAAWMAQRTSAWPYLAKWGECFGWKALRVRTLDRRDLHGGTLLADVSDALGVAPLGGSELQSNASPHWLELELVRRLTERNGEVEWAGVDHAEVEPLLAVLRPLVGEVAPAPYLRRETRERLLALYAADLDRIGVAAGRTVPAPEPRSAPDALAAPALSDAPEAILQPFFAATAGGGFAAAWPEASLRARRLAAEMGYAPSR